MIGALFETSSTSSESSISAASEPMSPSSATAVQGLVDAVRLVSVGARDQSGDLESRRQHRVDLAIDDRRQVVHRVRIQRSAGGHLQDVVVRDFESDQVVVPREVHGNLVHELGRHARAVEALAELEAQVLGVDLQDRRLVQVVLLEQDPVEGFAASSPPPAGTRRAFPGTARRRRACLRCWPWGGYSRSSAAFSSRALTSIGSRPTSLLIDLATLGTGVQRARRSPRGRRRPRRPEVRVDEPRIRSAPIVSAASSFLR